MVREDQVVSSCMDINGLGKISCGHDRALDVPSRSAFAPWTGPVRLALFLGLPQDKISRMSFCFVDLNSRTGFKILNALARQLAVTLERVGIEIDIPVAARIGIALVDQNLNKVFDLLIVFRYSRMIGCPFDSECVGILEILLDVFFSDCL